MFTIDVRPLALLLLLSLFSLLSLPPLASLLLTFSALSLLLLLVTLLFHPLPWPIPFCLPPQSSRSTQRMMFTPPKLMVSAVFAKLKEIATMTGSAVSSPLTSSLLGTRS